MGSRKRIALALDTDERGCWARSASGSTSCIRRRSVVAAGARTAGRAQGREADLCALPVHLQHGADGAPYISAGIDYALFPGTGFTNVGCRRIMLRGPRQAGVDLIAPSDMRAIYLEAAARNEPVPVAYAVGSHPADYLAAMVALPSVNELDVVGAVRGQPVPVVKCVTSDICVPADAEYVIEGFLDPAGHVEPEGPFGEYVGYYGVVKRNPVLHITAITHREDALFQTLTIGGRSLARTDTAQLTAVKTESAAWAALMASVREPLAVYATPSSGGMYNVRVSLRQRVPGDARNAIAAIFGSHAEAKHVFAFDPDIDVFSDEESRLGVRDALPGRPRSHRRLGLPRGAARSVARRRAHRRQARLRLHDPIRQGRLLRVLGADAAGSKAGHATHKSAAAALAAGPASFLELMAALGSREAGKSCASLMPSTQRSGLAGRMTAAMCSRATENRACHHRAGAAAPRPGDLAKAGTVLRLLNRDGLDKPGHDQNGSETMGQRTTAPFRADHVGSLLRPAALKDARAKHERNEITAGALRAVEDREISR